MEQALITSFLEMDTRIRTKEGQRELARFAENSGASDNEARPLTCRPVAGRAPLLPQLWFCFSFCIREVADVSSPPGYPRARRTRGTPRWSTPSATPGARPSWPS